MGCCANIHARKHGACQDNDTQCSIFMKPAAEFIGIFAKVLAFYWAVATQPFLFLFHSVCNTQRAHAISNT